MAREHLSGYQHSSRLHETREFEHEDVGEREPRVRIQTRQLKLKDRELCETLRLRTYV